MIANLIYAAALLIASPIVVYRMVRHGRYRRGARHKLRGLSSSDAALLKAGSDQCIWLHAVSVGEVNLLQGIVEKLTSQVSDTPLVISTSTDSGYELAVERFGAHRVFFCPLDFTWSIRRTIKHLSPRLIVLAELELWPNLIRIATDSGVPVSVINGRLSERSAAGYQRAALLLRKTFGRLDWVGCQDKPSAQRFRDCGCDRSTVEVTGSMKFDGVSLNRECLDVQRLAHWAGVDAWHRVWCFGSTQAGEEQLAIDVFEKLSRAHSELRLIIVPRHPERFDSVADLITSRGYDVLRRSSATKSTGGHNEWYSSTIILVDTIGELRNWWGVSNIATVGGSFGDRGGQNMLEPAGYGCAVSFGPNTKNFKPIADRLITATAAVRVAGKSELESFVNRCLTDGAAADGLGRRARELVRAQQGATEITAAQLLRLAGVVQQQPREIAKAA